MTPPAAAVAQPLPRRRQSPSRAPVRHPRRVSGPARPARPAAPARQPRARQQAETRGLALRVVAAYERIADSALLDRLVRGRLWIGLLAFGLIGIVAMQLLVLRLNTSIGAALERAASLQRANTQLRIEAATGSGEGRIEPLAAATGMTFAPSGSVHFVASSPAADVARAAQALSQPVQPHEVAAEASSVPAGETGGGGGEASAAAAPAASGEAASGETAARPSESGAEKTSAPVESHGAGASAATSSEPEPSAGAAGGVAAGH